MRRWVVKEILWVGSGLGVNYFLSNCLDGRFEKNAQKTLL